MRNGRSSPNSAATAAERAIEEQKKAKERAELAQQIAQEEKKIRAKTIQYVDKALGAISRITFQMGVSSLPHQKMLRAIEILGTGVAPIIRKELVATAGPV